MPFTEIGTANFKSYLNERTQEAVATAQYTTWTHSLLQLTKMALRLIVILGLILSAVAAPTADTSGFQFDLNQFFGTAPTQGVTGSMSLQDGSRTSNTGLGRTTFGETSGRSKIILHGNSNGDLDANMNSGSRSSNTPAGGASSSTWGRADGSATRDGVGAVEIGSKSGTLDYFGNGAASFSSGRGGGADSSSVVESLSNSFQNMFASGSSGKAVGDSSGAGASQVAISFQSQAQQNGLGGSSSARSMGNAGGTTGNGQRANVLTQHQAFSDDYTAVTSSQSRASIVG